MHSTFAFRFHFVAVIQKYLMFEELEILFALLEIMVDVNVVALWEDLLATVWLHGDSYYCCRLHIIFPICSTDGMNHTGCCQSRGIKTSCLGYCSGVMQEDLYDVNCLLDVPAMLTCFKENSLGKKWQTLSFCVVPIRPVCSTAMIFSEKLVKPMWQQLLQTENQPCPTLWLFGYGWWISDSEIS